MPAPRIERIDVAKDGRPARIKDVAELAGVSPGLVSRLLNNDASLTVRDDTRQAVLDAVRELDYVANSTATALRKSRTDTIGLVLKHITSPVFDDIVHGAQSAAAEAGCVLLLIDADEVESQSPLVEAMVKAHRVDGLLLQGGYGEGDEILLTYTDMIPSVIVNSVGNASAAGVRLEDELATRMATEHLIELGHRRLALIAGPQSKASDARVSGFTAALDAAGIACTAASVVMAGWEAADGYAGVTRALERDPAPTGFVVASSGAALGVLAGLAAAGRSVPGDVSVIGVQDAWFTPYTTPALTAVALPLFELGRRSVVQLLNHVRGGKPDDLVITDPAPRLVVRASTAPI